ncbi:MAG: hypothetical protein ACTSXH_01765 [Promethearchaeota archaeon]
MVKEKKKRDLGIKTARYYTKTCSNCQKEYPNWFTSCPYCHTPWDEGLLEEEKKRKNIPRKNIKIIAKISEEEFEPSIEKVQLIFSVDQGKAWYQVAMLNKDYYYIAEIPDIPLGAVIIYYIEVYLSSGEKIIENNENKYFFYRVGEAYSETTPSSPSTRTTSSTKTLAKDDTLGSHLFFQKPESGESLFPRPKEKGERELKICPKCNSKINKMLSICPICGFKQS